MSPRRVLISRSCSLIPTQHSPNYWTVQPSLLLKCSQGYLLRLRQEVFGTVDTLCIISVSFRQLGPHRSQSQFVEVLSHPVPIKNDGSEQISDQGRAAYSKTAAHDIAPGAASLVRKLNCKGEPWQQIVCEAGAECLEVQLLNLSNLLNGEGKSSCTNGIAVELQ